MSSGTLRTIRNGFDGLRRCSLLIVTVLSVLLHGVEAQGPTCNLAQEAETKAVTLHNEYRAKLAKRELDTKMYGDIPGSNNLFQLTYDCTHENLAVAMLNKDCTRSTLDLSQLGKGVNIYKNLVDQDPTGAGATLEPYFEYAIKQWAAIDSPLSSDAIYNNSKMISFANMINYKALKFGCTAKWCNKELVLVCVYSGLPKEGEQLYLPNSKTKTGCKTETTCKKVVKEDGACDPSGLCTTKAEIIDTTTAAPTTTTTSSTTSTAASSSSSSFAPTTTVAKANEGMTDTIRSKIVTMHNWRRLGDIEKVKSTRGERSQLAKGNIRNGKVGKANFQTAMDMYEMRYDTNLETQAQSYADQCRNGKSDVSSRQLYGENIYVTTSTTMQHFDVVVEGIKSWWKKIFSYGINYKMLYTQQLENKPNAPLGFTQMAWAASYKIGCGMSRCSFGTILVCRYSPRGNIYNQYIYKVGTLCGSCTTSCNDGLCSAPAS